MKLPSPGWTMPPSFARLMMQQQTRTQTTTTTIMAIVVPAIAPALLESDELDESGQLCDVEPETA